MEAATSSVKSPCRTKARSTARRNASVSTSSEWAPRGTKVPSGRKAASVVAYQTLRDYDRRLLRFHHPAARRGRMRKTILARAASRSATSGSSRSGWPGGPGSPGPARAVSFAEPRPRLIHAREILGTRQTRGGVRDRRGGARRRARRAGALPPGARARRPARRGEDRRTGARPRAVLRAAPAFAFSAPG